ncbi:unnamed protein product [Closterium sp. NIES-65]|nr:unnamed protein product [Closterium sp. NIES-65]
MASIAIASSSVLQGIDGLERVRDPTVSRSRHHPHRIDAPSDRPASICHLANQHPAFPLDRLPDDVLSLVLQHLSRNSLAHAFVCKRWFRLTCLARVYLKVPRAVHSAQLLSAVDTFPTLSQLDIAENTVPHATDELLRGISARCPNLTRLLIGYQFRARFSPAGLSALFRGCARLQQLRLFSLSGISALPASLTLLSQLEVLELGDDPAWRGLDTFTKLIEPDISLDSISCMRKLVVSSRCFESLPWSIGELTRLEHLEIHSEVLSSLPGNFGQLGSLAVLKLEAKSLEELPESLGRLKNLQRLWLTNCESLSKLPDSFGQLSSLSFLSIHLCDRLRSLPESFSFLPALETLKLHELSSLRTLPELFGHLPKLRVLDMSTCGVVRLPFSLYLLARLERLSIAAFPDLPHVPPLTAQLLPPPPRPSHESLPPGTASASLAPPSPSQASSSVARGGVSGGSFSVPHQNVSQEQGQDQQRARPIGLRTGLGGRMQEDEEEEEERADEMQEGVVQQQQQQQQQEEGRPWEGGEQQEGNLAGNYSHWSVGRQFPSSSLGLSSLVILEMTDHTGILALPEDLGCLPKLELLRLVRLDNFTVLPDSLGQLKSLRKLMLSQLPNLEYLPASLPQLPSLELLVIHQCANLASLPRGTISGLRNLSKVALIECTSLCSLDSEEGKASRGGTDTLRHVLVFDCGMKSLPPSLLHVESLQTVHFRNGGWFGFPVFSLPEVYGFSRLRKLSQLPERMGSLASLQQLRLRDCTCLVSLPDSFGQLRIELLELYNCASLTALPHNFGSLSQLQTLRMIWVYHLSNLPDSFGQLSNLRHLELEQCTALRDLPGPVGSPCQGQIWLPALESLRLVGLRHLDSLPPLGQLKNLRRLTVSLLWKLEELPPSLSLLSNLQTLVIHGCSQLKSLPHNVPSALSSLSSLAIRSCLSIQDLDLLSFCNGAMEACSVDGVEGRVTSEAVKCDALRCDNVEGDSPPEAEMCTLAGDFSSCTSVTAQKGKNFFLSALSAPLRCPLSFSREAKARRDLGSNSSFLPCLSSVYIVDTSVKVLPEALWLLPSLQCVHHFNHKWMGGKVMKPSKEFRHRFEKKICRNDSEGRVYVRGAYQGDPCACCSYRENHDRWIVPCVN